MNDKTSATAIWINAAMLIAIIAIISTVTIIETKQEKGFLYLEKPKG